MRIEVADILARTAWPPPEDPTPVPDVNYYTQAEAIALVQQLAKEFGPALEADELAAVGARYGSESYGVDTFGRFLSALRAAIVTRRQLGPPIKTLLALLLLIPALASAQAVYVPSSVPTITDGCVLQWSGVYPAGSFLCSAAPTAALPLPTSAAGTAVLKDATTASKRLTFDISGISASTTRTWTVGDVSLTFPSTAGTLAILGANTFTGLQTLNGGLAATTGTFSSTLGVTGTSTFASSISATVIEATSRLQADSGSAAVPSSGSSLVAYMYSGDSKARITSRNWSTATDLPLDINASAVAIGGTLTVSGTGTSTFGSSYAGANALYIDNPLTGNAAAISRLYVRTDTSGSAITGGFEVYSASGGTSGTATPAGATVFNNGPGGLSIAATHASGAIRFYTSGTTLRWTIKADGNIESAAPTAGTTYTYLGYGGYLETGIAGTDYRSRFGFSNGNGNVGSISTNGSATAYNTSSDARLKLDRSVVSTTDVLSRTLVHDFDWKVGGSGRGVFAQEAYEVIPAAVSVGTDELTADGHLRQPWAVDYSKYVPDLIVGWQSHDARIARLEAEIKALKEKQ